MSCACVNTEQRERAACESAAVDNSTLGKAVSEVGAQISADDEVTLSGDISIEPIVPVYPEERETTLELVREYPLGKGGIPFGLIYEYDPAYAMIETPLEFFMDEVGNVYSYLGSYVCDLQTSKVLKLENDGNFGTSLYAYNGKIYCTTTTGKLNVYTMERGLESSVQIVKANTFRNINLYPADDGVPMVRVDAKLYHSDGSKASCDYSLALSKDGTVAEGLTLGGVSYHMNNGIWIMSDLNGVLTVKEHRYRSFASRYWVDEYIFYQFGNDGNPISEFAIYQTWSPENLPCYIVDGDAVCEWYRGTDVLIGKERFENVLDTWYFVGTDQQFYMMLIYPDCGKLYRIGPGCMDVEPLDFENMEDPANAHSSQKK